MRRIPAWVLLLTMAWAGPAWSVPGPTSGASADAEAANRPDRPATAPADPNAPEKREQIGQLRRKARKVGELNHKLLELFRAGKYEQCEPLVKELLEIAPNDHVAWYNYACVHSRLGRTDEAIACLNRAMDHGYSGFLHLQRDPDLDPLRQTPGYKKLLAREERIQRERAEKIRSELRAKFGQDYYCQIDHERKLVFATNVDRQTLDDMKARLTEYATAQWQDLFEGRFDRYLTIIIPTVRKKEDWPWGPAVGGMYSRGQHVLWARTIGQTLLHEFTHALHAADQDGSGQQHPIWITEGLATLFEDCKVVSGHAVPQPNRRLNILQQIVRRKGPTPLKHLMNYTQAGFMRNALTAYAEGRYVMMYLHHKGVLKQWYDAYKAGYDADRSGAKAMEKVLGSKLSDIEADWKKWVLGLPPPILRLPPKHAYLGIQLLAAIDGVRVMRVVPGSGADRAGLKVDDVIVQVDDERTIKPAELMDLVYTHEVGDEVRVRFRRDGKYHDATVTLGALPEPAKSTKPSRQPATRPAPRPRPKRRPQPTTQPASRPASAPATRKAA